MIDDNKKVLNKNVHKGHRKRLRQRFIKETGKNFEEHELLELLLYYCVYMKDTNELAHKLLKDFKNLNNLFSSTTVEIVNKSEVSEKIALFLSIQGEVIRRFNNKNLENRIKLNSSEIVGEYAIKLLKNKVCECFYLISLDAQKRLINANSIIEENIDDVINIFPKIIVEYALINKATSIILLHKRLYNNIKPNYIDIEIITKIIKVLNIIDIDVVDYIIVSNSDYFSFADEELIMNYDK